jgi:Flp pilus assembly protein TadB
VSSSLVPAHAAHVGTLLGPALLIAFWAGWSDLRSWMHRQGDQLAPAAVLVAAPLSAGAGVIHAMVSPEHFGQDVLYGAFFAAAATAQLGWSVLAVVRPHPRVLRAGVLGSAAALVLWMLTRTAGVPLGEAAGQREPVGMLDVVCGLLELGVIACCIWAIAQTPDRSTPNPSGPGRNMTTLTTAN